MTGISHINPLIIKAKKVGISLQNAYAYVLLGFPSLRSDAQNPKPSTPNRKCQAPGIKAQSPMSPKPYESQTL